MTIDDDKLRNRLAEMMSSAGLGYNQISLEILYLLPKDFINGYIAVWEAALGPAGGGDRAGQQLKKDAELGKHKTETKYKGARPGAGGGGQGKRYKKIFVIRDEQALELKGRMDRRLRSMAREMMLFIDGSRANNGGEAAEFNKRCVGCGRIGQRDWRVCPYDGQNLRPIVHNEGKENDR